MATAQLMAFRTAGSEHIQFPIFESRPTSCAFFERCLVQHCHTRPGFCSAASESLPYLQSRETPYHTIVSYGRDQLLNSLVRLSHPVQATSRWPHVIGLFPVPSSVPSQHPRQISQICPLLKG